MKNMRLNDIRLLGGYLLDQVVNVKCEPRPKMRCLGKDNVSIWGGTGEDLHLDIRDYYIKVSGIASGNKLIKTIRVKIYLHM